MAGDPDVAGGIHPVRQPNAGDFFISPIDFGFERPDGRLLRRNTTNAHDAVVFTVDPDFTIERIFVPALG